MAITKKYRQSPNYSRGRPAGPANMIVIHHWDDPAKKPSFAGVVNWLCRPDGTSSAHYVAEDGRWTQLVSEEDRAWHAGPAGNPRGIGIECNPRMSKGDLETVAQLIADIRRRKGNLPLYPHKAFMSTSCPGSWAGRLDWLSARANEILAGKPAPAATPGASLTPDGYWGSATTRRLQQVLGTPVDGVVSSQSAAWRRQNPGLTSGWQWVERPAGSQVIIALQKKVGVTADGLIGPATIKALQKRMGTTVDGVISAPSACVIALQKQLNKGRF